MSLVSNLMARANAVMANLVKPAKVELTADTIMNAVRSISAMYGVECKVERVGERKLRVEMEAPGSALDSIEFVLLTNVDGQKSTAPAPTLPPGYSATHWDDLPTDVSTEVKS